MNDFLKMRGLPEKLHSAIAEAKSMSILFDREENISDAAAVILHGMFFSSTHSWIIPTLQSIEMIINKLQELDVKYAIEIGAGSGLLTALLQFVAKSKELELEIRASDTGEEGLGKKSYVNIETRDAVSAFMESMPLFTAQGKVVIIWSRGSYFIEDLLDSIIANIECQGLDIVFIFYTDEGYEYSCEPKSFFEKMDTEGFKEILSLDPEDSVEIFNHGAVRNYNHLRMYLMKKVSCFGGCCIA